MGKSKQRTKKPFLGRQKKKGKIRRSKVSECGPSHGDGEVDFRDPEPRVVVVDQPEPSDFESLLKYGKSASAKKLKIFKDLIDSGDLNKNGEEDCYLFVQLSAVVNLLSPLLCPKCLQPGISFNVSDVRHGLAVKGMLSCNNCDSFCEEKPLCNKIEGPEVGRTQTFDINVRATLAFRGIGCGYSSMIHFLGLMNMPYSPSQNLYRKNLLKIETAATQAFQSISKRTHLAIRSAYQDIGVHPDENGILDIAVSFDISWQKRGFKSHNGMASVIDLLTGFIIDFEVLSNYCGKCKVAEEQSYADDWKAKHALNCEKNFDGSAGSMEVECAKRIWARSIDKNQFRYITFLSDGDSKAYDAVSALNLYDTSRLIQKEDCINHVSKRMGTALRNLVESSKAQKKSISGKGKLTKDKIAKIQNYYGRAIKDNVPDIDICQKRIMAILLHLSSTDIFPKHQQCPPGTNSWCFFQRSLATNKDTGSHKEHETIPPDIGKQLVPIFQRLSDKDLLMRCSRNKTQNQSESFHNIIWKICPKTVFAGLRTVSTAVKLAACQFVTGQSFNKTLCTVLQLKPGRNLEIFSKRKDIKRVRCAEAAVTFKAKKRRRQLKYEKTIKDRNIASSEGSTYEAGKFND